MAKQSKVYSKGMGQAVADRTINRKVLEKLPEPIKITITLPFVESISLSSEIESYCKTKGLITNDHKVLSQNEKEIIIELNVIEKFHYEKWSDVAQRVALGNTLLNPPDQKEEYEVLNRHLQNATILLSGRHLQHGDSSQPTRNMEVFTNCATSAMSFLEFYLLLNGSGVGRCMDDAMMVVDYRLQPIVIPVIDRGHPDVLNGEVVSSHNEASARLLYKNHTTHYFLVPDSREGWAKAIEKIELLTYEKTHRDEVLLLDFSNVRPRGAAIHGMQDRPAAGPGPLMLAIEKIANLREAQMLPWRSTMFVDHYLAECVLVGGARRAARMATKSWRDETIFDFIQLKKGGELWSSNNSVTVDAEFWKYVTDPSIHTKLAIHARAVFLELTKAAYFDHTGEPGIINQDKLTQNDSGFDGYLDGNFAVSKKYQLEKDSIKLAMHLAYEAKNLRYHQITNPCGEITLNLLGGYCILGDVVPYHAESDDEAIDAFRATTRALLRVNLMDNMYKKEVVRTNRIGVGITGLHEWAWKRFGFGWADIINEEKSKEMWLMLSQFKRAVVEESILYSKKLGQNIPHTNTTIKPAGTTSKLFGLTEGAHLPSMKEFLRWVQFRSDDPQILEYKKRGYPTRELKSYNNTTIVGFPTQPEICKLEMKEKLVTAAQASPSEQYQYLKLLEKYWIRGVSLDGITPLLESGNQVSYTLKYDPKKVNYDSFCKTLIEGQSEIRCCSVMPFVDTSAYEYQPEEAISREKFLELIEKIDELGENQEDIAPEHIDCITSACPIDFKIKE